MVNLHCDLNIFAVAVVLNAAVTNFMVTDAVDLHGGKLICLFTIFLADVIVVGIFELILII